MRGKGFLVLIVLTAVVVLGVSRILQDETPAPQTGQLMFGDLLARVNDVVRVDVTSAGKTFTLQRADKVAWVMPSEDEFPVESSMVSRLLLGMANLERLQPKTGKAERFVELGLRDPATEESNAVGFSLLDTAGSTVANVIVGNARPAKGDATREEFFVRVPDEANSWLVIGTLPASAGDVFDWLQSRILAITHSRIARSRMTHADGEVVTVARKTPEGEFAFVELPEGERAAEAWRINDIGNLFVDLNLNDVGLPKEIPADATQIAFEAETFDGLRVRMKVFDIGPEPLVQLSAEFDESLVVSAETDAAKQAANAEMIRAEVAELNERWSRWVYTVSKFKGDTVRRRQKDLIREPEPDAKQEAVNNTGTVPPMLAAPVQGSGS
ncbi:MAG: hypothetical protein ACI9DC_001672 [Gammaproteobacteria bacterium]|jgi:hypothetical protein